MKKPDEGPSEVVLDAIRKRYPADFEAIKGRLQWEPLMGCWSFWHGDMFHGVELDGHLHT